ncbi:MAG: MotA/TolQ/ExbB proton channel family protein [Proteobacteria bacterium]|nr:MotA/TolQ/ExbB proton channel family protein [Pseudomonadota bacterium]
MNRICALYFATLLLIPLLLVFPAFGGQDMRELQTEARASLQQLKEKAAAEEESARGEATLSREQIATDRTSLDQAVRKIEAEVTVLEKEVAALAAEEKRLEDKETALLGKLAETDSVIRELVGVIRIHAKDLQTLITGNLQTALAGSDTEFLEAIAAQAQFPGMADIVKMNQAIRSQLNDGGTVRLTRGQIVDRTGNSVEADILVLGNFTAAYRLGEEVGFLNYSPAGRKLFALSRLPSGDQQKQLRDYMAGRSDAVPIDISRGGALGQLTRTPNLWQQIESGGPLVWPILAILIVAIVIVLERAFFLLRNRLDADAFCAKVETLAGEGNWQSCAAECARLPGKPVARVIAAGLAYCEMQREAMENALQEAILKEIPPMERFLSTLGMLAAIAPLLGLLGTVTGMIDTFHIITQYGTGDPRMMSGGISVALVTTMLGLSVAIPIMLVHTLLNRAVDNRIAQLEEKAVGLVNLVQKNCDAHV